MMSDENSDELRVMSDELLSGSYKLNLQHITQNSSLITLNSSLATHHSKLITLRRSYVTLIEIVIVLAILSMVIGFVGFNLANMAKQERFKAGTSFLVDRLQLAQDIMILFGTDVKAILKKQGNGMAFHLELDKSQLKGTVLEDVIRPILIVGIETFTFTNVQGVSQTDQTELLFMSRGTKMSQGDLMLTAEPGNSDLTRYISLTGYPQVIRYSAKPKEHQAIPDLSQRLYPAEVAELEQKRNAEK